MSLIKIYTDSRADLGAILQRYIDALPDINEGHSTDCTTVLDVQHCQRGQHELQMNTPVVWGRDKQVHITTCGPYGTRIYNNTGQDNAFEVFGGGVGQNAHFSNFSLWNGCIAYYGRTRGSQQVTNVKFRESPSYAIKQVDDPSDATPLGPTNSLFYNNYFDLCNGCYEFTGSTLAFSKVQSGKCVNNKKIPVIANSLGLWIEDVFFQACDEDAYIKMSGEGERSVTQYIRDCRFGGEDSLSTATPDHDVIIEETGETVGRLVFDGNQFNGSVTNGDKKTAIEFRSRPRDIHITNNNNFDGPKYSVALVGESWTNGLNPSEMPASESWLRNYWGHNRISGTPPKVFENGGVGWEMPEIDMQLTNHNYDSSTRRIVLPDRTHALEEFDINANPIRTAVPYI